MWRHWLRVAEAMALLVVARLLVARVRFAWWRGGLGEVVSGKAEAALPISRREMSMAQGCALAVRRAALRLPGSLCLPQAMALQWMLRRRTMAATLVMGVADASARRGRIGDLHAWLELGGHALLDDGSDRHRAVLRLRPSCRRRSGARVRH